MVYYRRRYNRRKDKGVIHLIKFKVGDTVEITKEGLKHAMTPSKLVSNGIIKNIFTTIKIDDAEYRYEGKEIVWISLKECCGSRKGCIAHPSCFFKQTGKEKVIFT